MHSCQYSKIKYRYFFLTTFVTFQFLCKWGQISNKQANSTAAFGARDSKENYYDVSILTVIAKIFEKYPTK